MSSLWLDMLGAEVGVSGGRHRGRYVAAGAGEPLILLHGQGGHLENFARNIAAYATRFRVYALDALWHGLGPQPPFEPELIPAFVGQVLDFMDWLGLDAAHVEGQSLGGWTAMRLAHDHPGRVRKLVLTTVQGFAVTLGSGQRFEAVPGTDLLKSQLEFLADPSLKNIKKRMSGLFADPAVAPEEMVAVRQRLYCDPTINAALRAVVTSYMGGPGTPPRRHLLSETELAEIAAPTLVYWADRNPGPPDAGERLAAAIPGARYVCAADTGHWAQFENAEAHNREVLKFLNQTQTSDEP